jgi:transposase-like protein
MNPSQRTDPPEQPKFCPFCRSTKIVAAGKSVTEFTYWRCESCSEMWNPARPAQAPRRPRW